MIIQKVINNNVVSTFDSNGKEVILMGKGIGFRKKTGDELDKKKIEKIFTLDLSGKSSFVQEVMAIIQEFYEIVLDNVNTELFLFTKVDGKPVAAFDTVKIVK